MSMRAVRVSAYGEPEVLKLENIPKPTPKEGEVLVRVHSSGVNPLDTYLRSWYHVAVPPFVTGLDGAGVVEEVGQGVTEFKKGDRVYLVSEHAGTCADYTAASVRHVALLSDKLSFAQGASIGIPYYTAYKALYTLAHAKPGETVLIHGASGAVGTAAVQVAVANGQIVFGTAGTEEGLQLVKKLGAHQVFNHRDEGYIDKILAATGGKGVDVILEMLANVNLNKDLDIMAYRGRILVVGSRGTTEFNPLKTTLKESSILGISISTTPRVVLREIGTFHMVIHILPFPVAPYSFLSGGYDHVWEMGRQLTHKDGFWLKESEWTEIKAGIQAGQKEGWLVPVVAKEYRLEDVAQAHIDIMNNSGTLGKLVVNVAGN